MHVNNLFTQQFGLGLANTSMSGLARRQKKDKSVNQLISICRYLLTLNNNVIMHAMFVLCDIQHLVNLHTVLTSLKGFLGGKYNK